MLTWVIQIQICSCGQVNSVLFLGLPCSMQIMHSTHQNPICPGGLALQLNLGDEVSLHSCPGKEQTLERHPLARAAPAENREARERLNP